MLDPNFVYLAVVINLAGTVAYFVTTLKGQTRPNRVTWFIWSIVPLIAFAAQLSKGVGIESLLTLSAALGPLAILGASFINKNAYWKISKFDLWCGSVSLAALAAWGVTREGLVAIALVLVADLLAGVPTIVKSYLQPRSENAAAYVTASLSGVITLLTIPVWTFANVAFPIYLTAVTALISALILIPRRSRELPA